MPEHPDEQGFDLKVWPARLRLPLRWKRLRRIFVTSMSDLFHKAVPVEYSPRVFDVMVRADRQVFTMCPRRMATLAPDLPWPPHVWAGTSVELDRYA